MSDATMDLEMRIGADAALAERAIRAIDPAASVRIDERTGIAHVRTDRQALEIEEALTKAGIDVTAASG